MKIYVLGAKGRLGSDLVKRGCIPFECDITDETTLAKLKIEKPDVLINTIGFTDVDGCERDVLKAYRVNALGIYNIAKHFGGYFIQISTDYVFDGTNGPYGEGGTPNPIQTYGFSKFTSEVITKQLFGKSLIVRTTNLYDSGATGKSNFALWVLNNLKENKLIKITDDLKGNPTYVPHLSIGILDAIDKGITDILNIVGETVCSRFEFAQYIAKSFGLDSSLVTKGNFFVDARRPPNNGLLVSRAREFGVRIYDINSGLESLKLELNYK